MGGWTLLISKASDKIDTPGTEEIEQFTFSFMKSNH